MTKCDMKYGPINMDESKMKGTPLFDGTDVPVKAFFEYLEAGKSVEKFLNDYPSVSPHPFLFHQSSSFITAPLLKDASLCTHPAVARRLSGILTP
jgi:uncharacterized protein (DUF433 family)